MSDDDLLLDASDLADIFGVEDEAKSGEDLAKSIEDLFFSDEPDEPEAEVSDADFEKVFAAAAAPSAPAAPRPAPAPAPAPVHVEDEPEVAEPDRGGLTEEEWRASPAYSEFKKQVIARHLRQKALNEAKAQAAHLAEIKAAEEAAEQAKSQADANAHAEAEKRKQEMLDKYKAAKAATIAQKAQAMVQGQTDAANQSSAEEQDKAAKLKSYLADLKAKVAAGGMPQLAMSAKHVAPKASGDHAGLDIDVVKAKALAGMFEETRSELLKHVSDTIGKKPAQAMMKKTLAKVAKQHLDVYGRAAVDPKNELRVDGALDEDKLARAVYGLPAESRVEKTQKAFYELIEMRFIAVELGLGHRAKAAILTKTLNALESSFAKKGHPADLVKWYMGDVIPSTSLADSDDPNY
jgi:hypothetical protein